MKQNGKRKKTKVRLPSVAVIERFIQRYRRRKSPTASPSTPTHPINVQGSQKTPLIPQHLAFVPDSCTAADDVVVLPTHWSHTSTPMDSSIVPPHHLCQPSYFILSPSTTSQHHIQQVIVPSLPIPLHFTQHPVSQQPRQQVLQDSRIQQPHIEVIDRSNEKKALATRPRTVQRCEVCGRDITRDFTRHMRTHDAVSRFRCVFPPEFCTHKTGSFNRQYDFKKHLLHTHFIFNDPVVRRMKSLHHKLNHEGRCLCGKNMVAQEWLEHITTMDTQGQYVCPDLRQKWKEYAESTEEDKS